MKKLFFISLFILICGCSSSKYNMGENYIVPGNKNVITTIVADGTLIDENNIAHTSSKFVSIHKFKYYGHRYIIFDNTVLHDPNCDCLK